jgi:hypothetical protein
MSPIRWYVSVSAVVAVVAAGLSAQSSAMPKPSPEHKKLEALLGSWTYEGDATKSPFSPAGKVSGSEIFSSGPGGFVVEDRWDEKDPLGNVKGLQIWGYDPLKKLYTYNYFTSVGEIGGGTVTMNGSTWTWNGSGVTYEGKNAWSRGTITFTGPNAFTQKAEASPDGGKTWAVNFEGKWTKK